MLACSYREGPLGATVSLGGMGVMMRERSLARGPRGVSFVWSVGVAWGVGESCEGCEEPLGSWDVGHRDCGGACKCRNVSDGWEEGSLPRIAVMAGKRAVYRALQYLGKGAERREYG